MKKKYQACPGLFYRIPRGVVYTPTHFTYFEFSLTPVTEQFITSQWHCDIRFSLWLAVGNQNLLRQEEGEMSSCP